MAEQVILTKEELNQIIESALKRCQHDEPSKQTLDMIHTINDALFGELKEDGKRHGGLIMKTNEMYDVFVVGKSGTTLIKWIGGTVIALLGILSVIKGLLK